MTPSARLRRTLLLLGVATLSVFGALVFGLTAKLRERPRAEVLRREANAMHEVALLQVSSAKARLTRLGFSMSTDDVFTAVLEASRMRGVLAVQLFDPPGTLRESLPEISGDAVLGPLWWPQPLTSSISRFHEKGALEEVFGVARELNTDPLQFPLLEIVIPLDAEQKDGIPPVARFWIDGSAVDAELRRMDQSLFTQAGLALAGGGASIALLLIWAYRTLSKMQRQLLDQSADLLRANQELDFAAKTAALGAISAHLIHGLKNPLAGLEGYVSEAASGSDDVIRGQARQTAVETTRRLKSMVNEVVSVLRDESSGSADYPVPVREAVEAVEARAVSSARAAGVELTVNIAAEADVKARTANLAGLVLANLLANAIEASPAGSVVRLDVEGGDNMVRFLIRDSGGGLPPSAREALFRPVRSSKPGGGGMGLAISHRLARHAGGDLTLVRSDKEGTVFELSVPAM